MKRTLLLLVFASLGAYLACTPKKEAPAPVVVLPKEPVVIPKYSFEKDPVWQDEFDYTGSPDTKKWGYDTGSGGWGNNEKQYYSKEQKNSRVENGKLIIEAIKEQDGAPYSSARLVTKNKGDFLYGKFEIKAKLPKGVGTWPAVWMLPTEQSYGSQYWPDNGEIDIMEHVGYDQDNVHGNIHTKAYNHAIGTNKGNNVMVTDASKDFHLYSCEWYPDSIKVLVDNKSYFKFERYGGWEQWPFDKKFHLILNIAVGGNWGGARGIDDSVFPQRMEVDYVRVYALKKE